MTNDQMSVYKMRITQAGIAELTLIMLEMEMQWMTEALEAYDRQDEEEFLAGVDKAQAVQVELMNVMNMDNPIAVDVYSVFAYVNKQLINAKLKRKPFEMERLKQLLSRHYKSFQAIAATDTEGPVMEQSEKIYAGLTYGSKGLMESSVGGTEYSV